MLRYYLQIRTPLHSTYPLLGYVAWKTVRILPTNTTPELSPYTTGDHSITHIGPFRTRQDALNKIANLVDLANCRQWELPHARAHTNPNMFFTGQYCTLTPQAAVYKLLDPTSDLPTDLKNPNPDTDDFCEFQTAIVKELTSLRTKSEEVDGETFNVDETAHLLASYLWHPAHATARQPQPAQ